MIETPAPVPSADLDGDGKPEKMASGNTQAERPH
jgi:hypothetical protein